MKPKKTVIKIKHSKYNLYNRRKSKRRRVIAVIVTVVCAAALCVLGFGIGRPLVEYFTGKNALAEDSSSAWTPPSSEELQSMAESESAAESDLPANSAAESNVPETPAGTVGKMYFLPEEAVSSKESLAAAIEEAKTSGCTAAAVLMKNDTGNFLYKTAIEGVADTEVVTGTLTAEQIAEAISDAGLVPAAKISTLKDSSCGIITETSYELSTGDGYWLDNSPTKGGKTWLSPFKAETQQFVGNICDELSKAGFREIIAVNTMYPAFHTVDISNYLSNLPLNDNAQRASALVDVLNSAKAAAEKNGAVFMAEITGEAAVGDSLLCTDAEFISYKDGISGMKIIVDYTPDDSVKDFAQKLAAAASGAEIYVNIQGESSGDIEKTFAAHNINVI